MLRFGFRTGGVLCQDYRRLSLGIRCAFYAGCLWTGLTAFLFEHRVHIDPVKFEKSGRHGLICEVYVVDAAEIKNGGIDFGPFLRTGLFKLRALDCIFGELWRLIFSDGRRERAEHQDNGCNSGHGFAPAFIGARPQSFPQRLRFARRQAHAELIDDKLLQEEKQSKVVVINILLQDGTGQGRCARAKGRVGLKGRRLRSPLLIP